MQNNRRLDASVARKDVAMSEEQGLSEICITDQNP